MTAKPTYDTIKVPISALRRDLRVHRKGGPLVKDVKAECALLADRMAKATSIASELEHVVAAEVFERGAAARAYDPQLLQAIRMYAAIGRHDLELDAGKVDKWKESATVKRLLPETIHAILSLHPQGPVERTGVALLAMLDRLRECTDGYVLTFNAWTVQMSTSTETWIRLHYKTYHARIARLLKKETTTIMDDPQLAPLYRDFEAVEHEEVMRDLEVCIPTGDDDDDDDTERTSEDAKKRHATLTAALPTLQTTTLISSCPREGTTSKTCGTCGKTFHRDVMAAENMLHSAYGNIDTTTQE